MRLLSLFLSLNPFYEHMHVNGGSDKMKEQLQELLEKRVRQCVSNERESIHTCMKIKNKKRSLEKRGASIVKAKAIGKIKGEPHIQEDSKYISYMAHFQYLIKQGKTFYIEEEVEERVAEFYKETLVEDKEKLVLYDQDTVDTVDILEEDSRSSYPFHYDRRKAVQYAEKWWNSHNPQFHAFEVDCTNYISQCLHAGGAPMRGFPARGTGWWMRSKNWSYSWSVAHSMRMHLANSTIGLRAKEVERPEELLLGDVICYDFQGDGRFDHTTIVTAKDEQKMPLVNAHTTNSRKRYWDYEDSTAYTENIKYKFFTIYDA